MDGRYQWTPKSRWNDQPVFDTVDKLLIGIGRISLIKKLFWQLQIYSLFDWLGLSSFGLFIEFARALFNLFLF